MTSRSLGGHRKLGAIRRTPTIGSGGMGNEVESDATRLGHPEAYFPATGGYLAGAYPLTNPYLYPLAGKLMCA